MDPEDPLDAQQVVIEYARMLERDVTENRHPGRVDSLPYAKPIIKSAICTSVKALAASGHLTDEMRDYLGNAYTYLAEYLEPELVDLMKQYRESGEQLAEQSMSARDRTQTAAWRTLTESGTLAGEVARTVANEAATLHQEFRCLVESVG